MNKSSANSEKRFSPFKAGILDVSEETVLTSSDCRSFEFYALSDELLIADAYSSSVGVRN